MAHNSAAAASNPAANWWPDVHATSLSSWSNNNTNHPWKYSPNPNSNNSSNCDQEDVSMSASFTNASNHSGLTIDSSRRLVESMASNEDLNGETVSDNHHQLWSHVLLSVGSGGEMHNSTDVGENILNAFSAKNSSSGMFEPACDYLKKMDNGWEFTTPSSLTNFQKNFNGFGESLYESEKLTKLSNLVSNWSIAPPDSALSQQFDHHQYTDSGTYDMKIKNEDRDSVAARGLLRKPFNGNIEMGYQVGLDNAVVGDNGRYYYGVSTDLPGRSFDGDVVGLGSCLSKPLVDINSPKHNLKAFNLSDCKKQALQTSYPSTISKCNTMTRTNGRGHGSIVNEGKKKRSEDNSGALLKKPKLQSSTVSSTKVQVPKAKLGEKITALQQIVSPFGKTDTASVLWEAIGYIKFLQEQVQLLSNPYMKANANKDPWGGLDRKDRDTKVDLQSRGLCLVPISCTPQVYRENNGSDYWTPTYRGCLYR